MKEATGDLNMTVVIVLIVAVMGAFFSMVVAPQILNGIKSETNCSDAICPCKVKQNGACIDCYKCETNKKTGSKSCSTKKFACPYKG